MVSAGDSQPGGRHSDDDDAPAAGPARPGDGASRTLIAGAASGPTRPPGRRRSRRPLWAGGVVALVVAILVATIVVVRLTADRATAEAAPQQPVAGASASPGGATQSAARIAHGGTASFQDPHPSAAPVLSSATPTRVMVPSIGVTAKLQSLKTDSHGVLQPPTNFTDAGWFSAGVRPGNIGPAVIAGHFDAAVGPAVFDKLRLVRPGAEIDVPRSDGTTARFRVTRSAFVSKALFPSSAVYGATPDAQLRLITCGGTYDSSVGHYDDNLVVFATLITPAPH